MLSALKKADDEQAGADLILRFYSLAAGDSEVVFNFGVPVVEAFVTDLREMPSKTLQITDNSTRLMVSPFEIVTLRIKIGETP